MTAVYLNGSFIHADQARISPMDRGFLFADGVYEVIPVFNGVMFRGEEHLVRLDRSLDGLGIARPHTTDVWMELCEEIVKRNGGGTTSVYLQVTRGAPGKRDHLYPAASVGATVFMATSPIGLSAVHDIEGAKGSSAILLDDIRWGRCDIKSIALLPNVMARQKAADAGAIEAIFIRDGLVTEGSSTNVFIAKDGVVATPPRSNKILGGITRQLVIELCAKAGLALEEREISKDELLAADEIWVSSSSKDAAPIVSLDGKSVGQGRPGPVWKKLAAQFLDYKSTVCGLS